MGLTRHDVRLAMRTLGKHPGFAATAIGSLGLAIALNTTMYSVLEAMIEPPFDIRQPEQLHTFRYYGDYHRRLDRRAVESALRSGLHGYEAVTGSQRVGELTVEHGAQSRNAYATVIRPDYLRVLGLHPLDGRLPSDADAEAGASVAVISDLLAKKLFVDRRAVGETIDAAGKPYQVIGVVTQWEVTDLWTLPPSGQTVRLDVIRLRAGVDPRLVENELAVLAARLAAAVGESPRETRFIFKPWMQPRQFRIGNFHYALAAAVLAVLFVACANLANLQLARGISRARELALRSALGASRGRLVGELLLESGIIAACGMALGLVLTFWGIHLVKATIPEEIAGWIIAPRASRGMLAVAAGASIVCLVLVGLLPALRISRVDPNVLLKSGAGTGAHGKNRRRYGVMVVVQIGLALPLLCGASAVLQTLQQVESSDYFVHRLYGMDPEPLVNATMRIDARPGSVVRVADVANQLVARTRTLHGVDDAAATENVTVVHSGVTVDDPAVGTREFPAPLWTYRRVSPTYFRTMGLPMVEGRDFRDGEVGSASVIVDSYTARYLWPNANPIGRRIRFGDARSAAGWGDVVGVLAELRDEDAIWMYDPRGPLPRLGAVYRTFTVDDSTVAGKNGYSLTIVARARGGTDRVVVDLRHSLRAAMPTATISVRSMLDLMGITVQRAGVGFVASIFTTFALLATGLVALGVYGIVSHSVAERRREFGVRISLGATARDILHAVLREGSVVALVGAAIGLLLTRFTIYWLGSFLGEGSATNAPLFAALAIALSGVTAAAAMVPALRATRIDPVEALRND